MSEPKITLAELPEHPILFIRRDVARPDLPAFFAECFPKLYQHGSAQGLAISGSPIARYLSIGEGPWTVDAVMPLGQAADAEGEMQAGSLQAGPAAKAVHLGPYERLPSTYQAIEGWMKEHGHRPSGPPWEQYVTDPGEEPDPSKWRTDVYWPVAR